MKEQDYTFEIRDRNLDDYFRVLLNHGEYRLIEEQNSRMIEILGAFAKAQTGQIPANLKAGHPTIFRIVKEIEEGTYTIPKYENDDYRSTIHFQRDSNLVNIISNLEEMGSSWIELRNDANRIGSELRLKYDTQHPPYFARDGAGFAHKIPGWSIGLLGLVIRGAIEGNSEQKIQEYFKDLEVRYSKEDLKNVLLLRERAIKLLDI